MSIRTKPVTMSIVSPCAFAVRRACVPFGVETRQSMNPVSAVPSDTISPPTRHSVAALKKSVDQLSPCHSHETTSKAAART